MLGIRHTRVSVSGCAARYGGEEFVRVLQDLELEASQDPMGLFTAADVALYQAEQGRDRVDWAWSAHPT